MALRPPLRNALQKVGPRTLFEKYGAFLRGMTLSRDLGGLH